MVRPRSPSEEHRQAAEAANALLVRWANAAFHLVVLDDVRGGSAAQLKEEMVRTRKLLTAGEWERLADVDSRMMHVYQAPPRPPHPPHCSALHTSSHPRLRTAIRLHPNHGSTSQWIYNAMHELAAKGCVARPN